MPVTQAALKESRGSRGSESLNFSDSDPLDPLDPTPLLHSHRTPRIVVLETHTRVQNGPSVADAHRRSIQTPGARPGARRGDGEPSRDGSRREYSARHVA